MKNEKIFTRDDLLKFGDPKTIKEIIIPEECTTINCNAFKDCENLEKVTGKNIIQIYDQTFFQNEALKEINFPNAKEIDEKAFYHCDSLEKINLPNVEYINNWAFAHCRSLKEIDLPNVEYIEECVFGECYSLEKVNLPNIKGIDVIAFAYCRSLKEINAPKLQCIGAGAFECCETLKKINFSKLKEIEGYSYNHDEIIGAFNGCLSLEKINLPNVEKIGENAFQQCCSLKEVSLPNVKIIEENVFEDCGIEKFTGENITEIKDGSFYFSSLKEINVPNVKKIGNSAFAYCSSLEKINLPNAKEIEKNAFDGCVLLKEVNLPNVEVIGEYAFRDCESLKEVKLPNIKKLYCDTFENTHFKNCNINNFIQKQYSDNNIDFDIKFEDKKTQVLWFSRHEMTKEQKDALGDNIEITQIDKTINNAYEIKDEIDKADIVAVVAPINLQKQFLDIAGDKPVIIAKSDRIVVPQPDGQESKVEFQFNKWEQIKEIKIELEDFSIDNFREQLQQKEKNKEHNLNDLEL